jgi:hypothetical protein
MKRFLVVAAVVTALVLPSSAAAKVRLVSVTSPIAHGAYATLTVAATGANSCSIAVLYKSGPSEAQGLVPKRPAAGRISWRWKVGTRTTPGRWRIEVNCGAGGSLRTSFVVT